MLLVHYVRPFFELGICKEYRMARKTTGTTTINRNKKTEPSTQPAATQVASVIPMEVRKNGKPANEAPANVFVNLGSANLEEEIRRRAYELYLERRATAGGDNGKGDENQDWLIAEREIREQRSA
jgi:hypothetical protein